MAAPPQRTPVRALKPRLRGWLHAGTTPVVVIAGILLISMSSAGSARLAAMIFTATAVLLFGTSAIYHRGTWSPTMGAFLKRLDHSNIFLIIAGSYTPFALLLPPDQARQLLILVWTGALAGVAFRTFWVGAPRWLYTPIYVILGWVAVFYINPLLHYGGWTVVGLVIAGGLLYTIGAVVYGVKRPDPWPRTFGFHEVFHALTIAAFAAHFVAATLVLNNIS